MAARRCTRVGHALVLLARRKTIGEGPGGLGWPTGPARPHSAGPAQELAPGKVQVGFFPFLFFFSIFLTFVLI